MNTRVTLSSPCTSGRDVHSLGCAAPSRCFLVSTRRSYRTGRALTVRADQNFSPPKLPKGVTKPPMQPTIPPALFGFNDNAERLNSRAAMIGFFALILLEFVAGKGILELVGVRIGNGLPFEI